MTNLGATHELGWRLMLGVGIMGILYSGWSLYYLTAVPFATERAFGVTLDQISSFDHGIARWIDLQVRLKTVFLSFMLSTAVLIVFVSYYGYRRGETWSWFALLVAPLFPLAAGLLMFGGKFLAGDIYGVPSIDLPLKVMLTALIPLYILGVALPSPAVLRQTGGGDRPAQRK